MTDNRDFDRAVAQWLDDGSDVTPPEVINAVLLAARSTPQERTIRLPYGSWRRPEMHKMITIGLGAAAVVLAVFVGAQLFGFGSGGLGGPGDEPTPTPEPSIVQASSSASGAWMPFPERCEDALEAGTYRATLGATFVTVSVPESVPDGWKGWSDADGFGLNSREFCFMGGGVTLSVSLVSHVYSSACNGQGSPVETATPASVTAALAAQAGHQTSGPSETTVAGYPASRLEFSFPADATTCGTRDGYRFGPLWMGPSGSEGHSPLEFPGSDGFVSVYVVDVEGAALAIAVDSTGPDEPADIAELEAMVASLRIEP